MKFKLLVTIISDDEEDIWFYSELMLEVILNRNWFINDDLLIVFVYLLQLLLLGSQGNWTIHQWHWYPRFLHRFDKQLITHIIRGHSHESKVLELIFVLRGWALRFYLGGLGCDNGELEVVVLQLLPGERFVAERALKLLTSPILDTLGVKVVTMITGQWSD